MLFIAVTNLFLRLRRLTRKPKVRTAVCSNPALDSLVAVRNSSPGRPEPCEGNLVVAAGSCGGLMVKHPWPLLEISLSDFRRLATLNINTYLPTVNQALGKIVVSCKKPYCDLQSIIYLKETFSQDKEARIFNVI